MKSFNILIVMLFLFGFLAKGQNLERKVSVEYKNKTIKEVLTDMKKMYGIKFSYVNNVIPLQKRIDVVLKNRTLNDVLIEIFKDTDVTFQVVKEQVVLKKDPQKNRTVNEGDKINSGKKETDLLINQVEDTSQTASLYAVEPVQPKEYQYQPAIAKVKLDTPQKLMVTRDAVTLKKEYLREKRKLRNQFLEKKDSLNDSGDRASNSELKKQFKYFTRDMRDEFNALTDTVEDAFIYRKKDTASLFRLNPRKPAESESETKNDANYKKKTIQVTLIHPIGTNGLENANTVNNVSFNIIAGYSAGLEGLELSGFANLEKDYVRGAQYAGFGNFVKNEVKGAQFAGFSNINGGYTQGVQIAGFMNVVNDSTFAIQGAGFMNLVNGNAFGSQFAGFMNVANGSAFGPQGAGFMNIARKDIYGVQVAGFMNVANQITGAQVAGFLNVGKNVKGSQIGVLNIADTVTGVQVGFLSISRKGYRRFEVFGSESFYTNITFKTGTKYFYNIFAIGVQPFQKYSRWGLGYGVGTELTLSRKMILNIDGLAYQVNTDEGWTNKHNLLNQLKTNFGLTFSKRTSIFLGPTFNVMVSDIELSDFERYSFDVEGLEVYDKTSGTTNVRMWLGFNAGIRF